MAIYETYCVPGLPRHITMAKAYDYAGFSQHSRRYIEERLRKHVKFIMVCTERRGWTFWTSNRLRTLWVLSNIFTNDHLRRKIRVAILASYVRLYFQHPAYAVLYRWFLFMFLLWFLLLLFYPMYSSVSLLSPGVMPWDGSDQLLLLTALFQVTQEPQSRMPTGWYLDSS